MARRGAEGGARQALVKPWIAERLGNRGVRRAVGFR